MPAPGVSIRPYGPGDSRQLLDAYREATGAVPHGFPPDEEELHAALSTSHPQIADLRCLVAERDGIAKAFVLLGKLREHHAWLGAAAGEGVCLGPFSRNDDDFADDDFAAHLLQEAHAHLRGSGSELRWAGLPLEDPLLPFYNAGFNGISDQMPRLLALLTRSGFRVRYRELNLEWNGIPQAAADIPSHVIAQVEQEDAHVTRITLASAAESLGYCRVSMVCPSRGRNPLGADVGYVCGLGVKETYRGAGWGRVLMRLGMGRLLEMGAKRIWLTTGAHNHTAQSLYYSLGFTVVDSCVTLARNI